MEHNCEHCCFAIWQETEDGLEVIDCCGMDDDDCLSSYTFEEN